jgi:hypothetical protein
MPMQEILHAFTLRKLFPESCQVIADAARDLEYLELIVIG